MPAPSESGQARCLYVTPDGRIEVDPEQEHVRKALSSGQGLLWYRVAESDESSREILRDVFGFHQLAIDDCFNGRVDTPKIDDYGSYLFIIAQSVEYEAGAERVEVTELDLFLGPNYVVTVSAKQQMPLVDQLFETAKGHPYLLNRGSDFLAHAILDVLVDQLLPAVEAMDEQLDALEQRILERPEREQLTDALILKRHALRLRRSILPQRDMVNRVSRGEFPTLIGRDALIFYRDIYDHVVRVEELLEGLRDLADSSLSSYLSAVNNRMNEVMKVLSVVAVIFLPLTLIASIYGTNLDYSPFGLTLQAGFFVMLAVMLVIAGAMVVFFRHRGWFSNALWAHACQESPHMVEWRQRRPPDKAPREETCIRRPAASVT